MSLASHTNCWTSGLMFAASIIAILQGDIPFALLSMAVSLYTLAVAGFVK